MVEALAQAYSASFCATFRAAQTLPWRRYRDYIKSSFQQRRISMHTVWFLRHIVGLALLLSLSVTACIQPIAAPAGQAIKPDDKIGEMVITQGPAPFDLEIPPYVAFCNANPQFELDSNVAKPGVYTVGCAVPPLPKMVIGFGWVTGANLR
jgi:hypothetical protein